MNPHLQHLIDRFPALAPSLPDIEQTFAALRTGYATDGKLLIAGSSDCAALTAGWAAALLRGSGRSRSLDSFWQERLGL